MNDAYGIISFMYLYCQKKSLMYLVYLCTDTHKMYQVRGLFLFLYKNEKNESSP